MSVVRPAKSDPILDRFVEPSAQGIRAIEAVPRTYRLPLLLHFGLGFKPSKLAKLAVSEAVEAIEDLASRRQGDVSQAAREQLEDFSLWYKPDQFRQHRAFSRMVPTGSAQIRLNSVLKGATNILERQAKTPQQDPEALPDFLVVGVPKAATSWLHNALSMHPEIFLPQNKELEFFTDNKFHSGVNWFLSHFTSAALHQIRGEVSVSSFSSPRAIGRLRQIYGERPPKVLVCLRDPVRRAQSHFFRRVEKAILPSDFRAAIAELEWQHTFIEEGKYVTFWSAWQEYIGPDRLKTVFFEDVIARPEEVLAELAEFLGVSSLAIPPPNPANVTNRVRLHRFYQALMRAQTSLRERKGKQSLDTGFGRLLAQAMDSLVVPAHPGDNRLPEEQQQCLRRIFAPANRALATALGDSRPEAWIH